jgi:hypothetical protein
MGPSAVHEPVNEACQRRELIDVRRASLFLDVAELRLFRIGKKRVA